MRKKILIGVLIFSIIISLSSRIIYHYLITPVSHEIATLTIEHGTPMFNVAEQLGRAGVIRSPVMFALCARMLGFDRRLQAGEYEFVDNFSPIDILKKLSNGEVKLYKITIIEGWRMEQIADYLASQQFAAEGFRESFVAACNDKDFLSTLGFNEASAEGFLFPSTYHIIRPRSAGDVAAMLIRQFNKGYSQEFEARAGELGLTRDQVITLASIIEKETGNVSERPVVSSVFHNRLKKGMPLQADPTVIYGLKDFNGNITKADLTDPHAYNTYVHVGLPPGPIANPGLAAIRAALWPAETDYLYFVSHGDGTHEFTSTLAEHNQAVSKYQ